MADYRPLSKIGKTDPKLDTLHEGLEPWMHASAVEWLEHFLWTIHGPNTAFIRSLERSHRVDGLGADPSDAANQITRLVRNDPVFGMDVIAFALAQLGRTDDDLALVYDAKLFLDEGGSAWEVSFEEGQGFYLSRKDLAAAKLAITAVEPSSARAGELLTEAWVKIAIRDPDPNGGFDKAVKAVEAAAQPVVSPKNAKATLGTIVRDLRAKPDKWTFELGDINVVIEMADRLWTTHIRHGTDPRTRTDHSASEADAALHLAIALVRFFSGNLVRRTA